MKEIQIQIRFDDSNQMASAIKTINLDKDTIEGISLINLALDNLKLIQLNKLNNILGLDKK